MKSAIEICLKLEVKALATVVGINYKDKEKKLISCRELLLHRELFPSKELDRQISIVAETLNNRLIEDQSKGFCHLKFKANLIIDGLDIDKVYEKQAIRIGDAILEITKVGKECHSNCPRLSDSEECNIHKNILFGRLMESGEVKIGDIMYL